MHSAKSLTRDEPEKTLIFYKLLMTFPFKSRVAQNNKIMVRQRHHWMLLSMWFSNFKGTTENSGQLSCPGCDSYRSCDILSMQDCIQADVANTIHLSYRYMFGTIHTLLLSSLTAHKMDKNFARRSHH